MCAVLAPSPLVCVHSLLLSSRTVGSRTLSSGVCAPSPSLLPYGRFTYPLLHVYHRPITCTLNASSQTQLLALAGMPTSNRALQLLLGGPLTDRERIAWAELTRLASALASFRPPPDDATAGEASVPLGISTGDAAPRPRTPPSPSRHATSTGSLHPNSSVGDISSGGTAHHRAAAARGFSLHVQGLMLRQRPAGVVVTRW